MATDKPRFTITIDPDTLEKIDNYRYSNRIKTQSKAILELIKRGLKQLEQDKITHKKAPSLSDGAIQIAQHYEKLDEHGQRITKLVVSEEYQRMDKSETEIDAEVASYRKELELQAKAKAESSALHNIKDA